MVQDVVNLADKADTVMSVSGDMVYFTDSRQRLAISDNDKILQIKSQIPSWETATTGITASSTDTLTNKTIAFGSNTITATLAQLDTALSTTGTASSSTFLRGDNSWSTAGADSSTSVAIHGVTKTLGTWLTLGV